VEEVGSTMNRTELIDSISDVCDLTTTEVTALLDSMIYTITVALRDGEAVRIGGFGTFKPRERQARWGRDAQTGAVVRIGASIGIGFVAGAGLKKDLNSGRPISSTSRLASGTAGAAEIAPTKKAPNRKAPTKKIPRRKASLARETARAPFDDMAGVLPRAAKPRPFTARSVRSVVSGGLPGHGKRR
jgi:DNA-binding protein HU-beta